MGPGLGIGNQALGLRMTGGDAFIPQARDQGLESGGGCLCARMISH